MLKARQNFDNSTTGTTHGRFALTIEDANSCVTQGVSKIDPCSFKIIQFFLYNKKAKQFFYGIIIENLPIKDWERYHEEIA